jgi:hypothetical protein
MTHDIIDRLVRPANPVPDPRMLESVEIFALLKEGKVEMQTQIEVEHVEEKSSRGGLIAIAAAVAVLIGGVVLFQLTRDSEVAAEPPPLEVATAYVEAFGAFDAETVGSMLAPTANVLTWEGRNDWRRDISYLEAAGFQFTFHECRESPPQLSGGVRVHCEYDAHGLGSDRIGLEPFGGSVFRVIIDDGLVVESNMGFDFTSFHGVMWRPFREWVQATHPEDFPVMYVDPNLSRQTEESLALWEERVADYVEYINNPTSSTTPEAGAVPPELAGTWWGIHPNGDVVQLRLDGTRPFMSISGIPDGLPDVVVSGDTMVLPASPTCPIDRKYTWSVVGEKLILTEIVEDTCVTDGYLDGVILYTRSPS